MFRFHEIVERESHNWSGSGAVGRIQASHLGGSVDRAARSSVAVESLKKGLALRVGDRNRWDARRDGLDSRARNTGF
ncbi:unnamed protein product [Diplocarpon coronariae]